MISILLTQWLLERVVSGLPPMDEGVANYLLDFANWADKHNAVQPLLALDEFWNCANCGNSNIEPDFLQCPVCTFTRQ